MRPATRPVLTIALAPVLTLLACEGRPGAETAQQMEMGAADIADVKAAITELNTAYEEAFNQGDVGAIAALYTEDAIQMPPNQKRLEGRAAIEQGFAEFFASSGSRTLVTKSLKIDASGDLAYDVGTYTIDFEMGESGPIHDEGKYLAVLKRGAEGKWMMVAETWNSSMGGPEGSGMSEMEEMSQ